MTGILMRVGLAAAPLAVVAWYYAVGLLRTGPWTLLASQAAWWTGLAALQLLLHAPWYSFPDGITAAIFGHAAWDAWRRGRKPRAERAAGRVVDLGHRLAVVTGGKR